MLESYHKELIQEGITDYSLAEIRDDYNYSCIMVLTMLATSGLTAEGSFDRSTDASMTFLLGYKYWYDRVENKSTAIRSMDVHPIQFESKRMQGSN